MMVVLMVERITSVMLEEVEKRICTGEGVKSLGDSGQLQATPERCCLDTEMNRCFFLQAMFWLCFQVPLGTRLHRLYFPTDY